MQKKPQQKSKFCRSKQRVEACGSLTLFIVGVGLVLLGTNHEVLAQANGVNPYDGLVKSFKPLDYGVCAILRFAEGGYGALLTTVAGIIAIASAAFGKYNQAYNMLIVAVGCFILRSFISLFFANYTCMNNDPTTLWHLPGVSSQSSSGNGDEPTIPEGNGNGSGNGDTPTIPEGNQGGGGDSPTIPEGNNNGDTPTIPEGNGGGDGPTLPEGNNGAGGGDTPTIPEGNRGNGDTPTVPEGNKSGW